ncbi:MAG: MFS transporter [Eubacterium sp.]|nr:MFS transporter [Eubacterium sp.]
METGKSGNFKRFLLLWGSELISSIGGGLSSFGLSVYVFTLTGSAAYTTLITLLAFLPTLLLSVPAGVLADRYDRRLLMMIGDGCSALGLVFILICMYTGEAAIWQICLGVSISSIFSALLSPAYRATITDLLTEEEYSRATGLVGLADNARYLISPLLAAGLLAISDIKLLLIIDICTFFLTVVATSVVRRHIEAKPSKTSGKFIQDMKDGWHAITDRKGLFLLIILASLISLTMGAIQTLSSPMVLDFSDSKTLGIMETICACGMLVTGLILGIRGIKKHFVLVMSASLALAGLAMLIFGWKENIPLITVSGFLFFSMLPLANNCLDYLARTNIPDELQGRAWGLIGFLSGIGCVVSYAFGGLLADCLAKWQNISVGRGSGEVIMISGGVLIFLAVLCGTRKSIRSLQHTAEAKNQS